jgi:hypothetical protein
VKINVRVKTDRMFRTTVQTRTSVRVDINTIEVME